MQNRSNRNLLFGSRSGAASPDPATAKAGEAMESDNQLALDGLRGSAGTMKHVALQIDSSVSQQNQTLDQMDKRFDNSNSLVSNTLSALNELANDRTSSRICTIIAVFFVLLLILFRFLKK